MTHDSAGGRWHAQTWISSLERHAFPRIGRRPVSEVNTTDVLEILTPIWHVNAETARTVRQRIRSVLEWAIAMDLRNDNPCDRVLPVLGPQNDIVTHRLALPHKDVAAAIETVPASGLTQPVVKLAFEFLVLTAARSREVRLATWTEIDTTGRVWTIYTCKGSWTSGPLKRLDETERQGIGKDLLRAQLRWPVGMPLCRPMGDSLWEIRTDLPTKRTARLPWCSCPLSAVSIRVHGRYDSSASRQLGPLQS